KTRGPLAAREYVAAPTPPIPTPYGGRFEPSNEAQTSKRWNRLRAPVAPMATKPAATHAITDSPSSHARRRPALPPERFINIATTTPPANSSAPDRLVLSARQTTLADAAACQDHRLGRAPLVSHNAT